MQKIFSWKIIILCYFSLIYMLSTSMAFGGIATYDSLQTVATDPVNIFTGMYVKSLSIDKTADVFYAEIYFWFRYDADIVGLGLFDLEQDLDVLEFVNGTIEDIVILEGYHIGDQYYLNGGLRGYFRYTPDYKDYPFDTPLLPIIIEHSDLGSDYIVFVADTISFNRTKTAAGYNTFSEEIKIGEMRVKGTDFVLTNINYNTDFGDIEAPIISEYSRLTFRILLERDYTSFAYKAIIPLIIVLTVAYMVFYVPAVELELSGGLTATSLLAAIAFQWTINSELPNVSGIILIDKVFYLAYFLIMASMVQTVYTYNLENSMADADEQKKRNRLSNRLEMMGRILYPVTFFGYILYIIVYHVDL